MGLYTKTGAPATLSSGASSAIRSEFALIQAGTDTLPSAADLKQDQYGADASASGALYVLTTTDDLGAYTTGMKVRFTAAYTNLVGCNVKVNGGATVALTDLAGTGLVAGIITAGEIVEITKSSGAGFQVFILPALAANLVATNADVVLTNADVVLTNADVVLTHADVVLTGNDVAATNDDVVSTNADVVATNADVVSTGNDLTATNADVVSSAANAALAATNIDTIGTSVTPNSISDGAKTFTVLSSKEFAIGMVLKVADDAAPTTNWMSGVATTSFTGNGTLGITIDRTVGSGTKTAWTITTLNTPISIVPILTSATTGLSPLGSGEAILPIVKAVSATAVIGEGNDIFGLTTTAAGAELFTSADGATWTSRTLPSSVDWAYFGYIGSAYVCVNFTGLNAASSTDLVTWTARATPANATYRGLASNGSIMFSPSQSAGNSMTTTDGITWSGQATPNATLYYATYSTSASLFVTFPNNSTTYYTSSDALTWTSRTLPVNSPNGSAGFGDIGGDVYVKENGGSAWYTASNGIAWTLVGQGPTTAAASLTKIDGVWLLVEGTSTGKSYTSVDFVVWVARQDMNGTATPVTTIMSNATDTLVVSGAAASLASLTIEGLYS